MSYKLPFQIRAIFCGNSWSELWNSAILRLFPQNSSPCAADPAQDRDWALPIFLIFLCHILVSFTSKPHQCSHIPVPSLSQFKEFEGNSWIWRAVTVTAGSGLAAAQSCGREPKEILFRWGLFHGPHLFARWKEETKMFCKCPIVCLGNFQTVSWCLQSACTCNKIELMSFPLPTQEEKGSLPF